MSESLEKKLLDVEDKILSTRIKFLQGRLLEVSKVLRSNVPEGMMDSDLTEDSFFKQWVICNTVYNSSTKDENNEGFNRMLYYMFEEVGGDVPRLLNQYDLKIDMNDEGQLQDIQLVVLETEIHNE